MRVHYRVVILVTVLVMLAGLFTLLIEDIDTFEARTGFFDRVGTWIINGIVGLVAFFCTLGAVSVFFPRRWGPKASIGGAIACAVVALFCIRVLWLGGA